MILNGKEMKLDHSMTVVDLLKELEIHKDKVVVEINFEIIPKESYSGRIINNDDNIEIVGFVGGG